MLMPLYHRFSFESALTPEAAAERLARRVGPRQWFEWGAEKPWLGKVEGASFHVVPRLFYQNSFRPEISGRFEPAPSGCRVSGTMYVHPLVLALMAVWMAFVLVGVVATARHAATGSGAGSVLTGLAVAAFGFALSVGGFTFEARRALNRLRLLFEVPDEH